MALHSKPHVATTIAAKKSSTTARRKKKKKQFQAPLPQQRVMVMGPSGKVRMEWRDWPPRTDD